MSFNLLLLRGKRHETEIIDDLVSGLAAKDLGVTVSVASSDADALKVIGTMDAAFGYLSPQLLEAAPRLRWLACPQAGPDPAFFNDTLVESDVIVTNVRGIFSDHICAHIMSFVLAFSRGLHIYMKRQADRQWLGDAPTVYLPEATVVIVGMGAIGTETAARCRDFGMRVIGVDPRMTVAPPGVERMVGPDGLHEVLPLGDFVISTVPESPATQGFVDDGFLSAMAERAFFINIGRGATVQLSALDAALRAGKIAGAALDVFEQEPLPEAHPLWDAPGMVITPHVATIGPYLNERRIAVFIDNCERFASGQPLQNVVDKRNWF